MSLFPVFAPSFTPIHVSVADDWEGATGSFTFTTGGVDSSGTDKSIRLKDGQTFSGDFDASWTVTTKTNQMFWGLYPTSEDGTFNDSDPEGLMASMTNSWYETHAGGTHAYREHGAPNLQATSISDGDKFGLKRTGTTIYSMKDDSVDYTFPTSSSAELRLFFGFGTGSTWVFDDVEWTGGS
jgi:hypothetical protein